MLYSGLHVYIVVVRAPVLGVKHLRRHGGDGQTTVVEREADDVVGADGVVVFAVKPLWQVVVTAARTQFGSTDSQAS